MQVTNWISYWGKSFPEELIDLDDEISKLWNPEKKFMISKDDADEYQKNHPEDKRSRQEILNFLKAENDKLPQYLDEEKFKELGHLRDECYWTVHDYCVQNKVAVTSDQHQSESFKGIPVVDGKYPLMMSQRAWGHFMADIWNQILRITRLDYMDFYCTGDILPPEVKEYFEKN